MLLDSTSLPLMGMIMAYAGISIVLGLALYIYSAIALMTVANKLKVQNGWLAFIPIANLYLFSQMAGMHWWPMLLLIGILIPFVNFICMIIFIVYMIIWFWKICEARGRPGWWVILTIIPLFGGIWMYVMIGLLAWTESK